MRWKVQLIAETASGQRIEGEIATIEREDLLSPATVGLTIAEGKGHPGRPAETSGSGLGSTSWRKHEVLCEMRSSVSHQGLLQLYPADRLRQRANAGSTTTKMSVHRRCWELVDGVHQENPITPELRYLTAKMAA
jgi:hypothetical protein